MNTRFVITSLTGLCLLSLTGLIRTAHAAPQAELEQAAQQQQVAFVLVSEPASAGMDAARDLVRQAMGQVERSTLVELDRSDPANAPLVARYRLAAAPVPLVLVAARNGLIAGGLPAAQASVERLVALVPSPKKAEILQALQDGKAVFICASRKGMATQPNAVSACASACGQSNGQCVLIEVDMDDPAEIGFLTQMKVDLKATEPVTLVINTSGQVTGTYAGAADVATLVQATTRKAGGCCPPTVAGGSQSCGPQKK